MVQERNWVTVEGLNVEYEKMGETKTFPGMMIKKELPLIVNRYCQAQVQVQVSGLRSGPEEGVLKGDLEGDLKVYLKGDLKGDVEVDLEVD